jgi:hypothetical protein
MHAKVDVHVPASLFILTAITFLFRFYLSIMANDDILPVYEFLFIYVLYIYI